MWHAAGTGLVSTPKRPADRERVAETFLGGGALMDFGDKSRAKK